MQFLESSVSGSKSNNNITQNLRLTSTLSFIVFNIEVIPDNWTQKFEPHGGQISKP